MRILSQNKAPFFLNIFHLHLKTHQYGFLTSQLLHYIFHNLDIFLLKKLHMALQIFMQLFILLVQLLESLFQLFIILIDLFIHLLQFLKYHSLMIFSHGCLIASPQIHKYISMIPIDLNLLDELKSPNGTNIKFQLKPNNRYLEYYQPYIISLLSNNKTEDK